MVQRSWLIAALGLGLAVLAGWALNATADDDGELEAALGSSAEVGAETRLMSDTVPGARRSTGPSGGDHGVRGRVIPAMPDAPEVLNELDDRLVTTTTTAPPTTTTTEPTTTTTESTTTTGKRRTTTIPGPTTTTKKTTTTELPPLVTVAAVGPGSPDASTAPVMAPSVVTLSAIAEPGHEYLFRLRVRSKDDGKWTNALALRWTGSLYAVNLSGYSGYEFFWTVEARDADGNRSGQSERWYFTVG